MTSVNLFYVGQAMGIVNRIAPNNKKETRWRLDALKRIVVLLWESVAAAGDAHQDVLAILENGVRQACIDGTVTDAQRWLFRKALRWLMEDALEGEGANTLRKEFLDNGFVALPFLDDQITVL